MKNSQKTLAAWLLVLAGFVLLVQTARMQRPDHKVPFTKFIEYVKANQVESVTFKGNHKIEGKLLPHVENGRVFETIGNTDSEYYLKLLAEHNLTPNYELEENNGLWMHIFVTWLPIALFVGVMWFLMKQVQVSGGKAMQFGRSRAKLVAEGNTKVTFADVAGVDEAKEELKEIVEFLRDPKKFTRLGGRIPKGVLLVGPPGTGKTLLAKAVAGEAMVPFFSISGSDFVEMFVGVGASRVRDLFEQGRRHAPCIIFIDEIDAVGRQRGAGLGGGHDEREQTLNQLLVEMDGFDSKEGVILVAATNRSDVLDPALLRPGRFDRKVYVSRPDLKGREEILKVHLRRTPLGPDVDPAVIARGTAGLSGADLQNLVNEAALLAARRNQSVVTARDFDEARDKVLMGKERRSMLIGPEERKSTAYHEAGHAIVGMLLQHVDPIHKVTIIPRGGALGLTQTLPENDQYNLSKAEAEDFIAFAMGGAIAEKLVLGQQTSGASNDIERATALARRMVCEWGMSDLIGPIAVGKESGNPFLGRDVSNSHDMSQKTAELVDAEIRRFIHENYQRATQILQSNMDLLHRMAQALLERETLDQKDLDLLLANKPLPSGDGPGSSVPSGSSEGARDGNGDKKTGDGKAALPLGPPRTEVA
jgi:cell division protease FtsH